MIRINKPQSIWCSYIVLPSIGYLCSTLCSTNWINIANNLLHRSLWTIVGGFWFLRWLHTSLYPEFGKLKLIFIISSFSWSSDNVESFCRTGCMRFLARKLWTVLWWSFRPSSPSFAIFLTETPTDNNCFYFFLSILNLGALATLATLGASSRFCLSFSSLIGLMPLVVVLVMLMLSVTEFGGNTLVVLSVLLLFSLFPLSLLFLSATFLRFMICSIS